MGECQSLTSSGARVQFIVQSNGMNCPVASQKGAIPPLLSMTGIVVAPKQCPCTAALVFQSGFTKIMTSLDGMHPVTSELTSLFEDCGIAGHRISPEVPKDTTHAPSLTAPAPRALI